MGSQEGGSESNGVTQTQIQDPLLNPITRQGSLYGLTFDEVQNQLGDLGKPLSNMNLDELLKTVWTVESSNHDNGPAAQKQQQLGQPASGPSLNQLSTDLSKKTVDEVWQDIQQGQKRNCLDRKVTLGEMTLEDFLVKAGVVAESRRNLGPAQMVADPMGLPQQSQWMNYQIPPPVFMPGHHPAQQPSLMDGANYTDTQMTTVSSSPLMSTLSDTQAPGRKRVAPDGIAERSVERRQKRMIKNRESAARSRARKQAYTQELENKVSRLEEENERLKRQKNLDGYFCFSMPLFDVAELGPATELLLLIRELEKMMPSIPPPEPKYQLRRTSSAPM
ncbi:abscisic acid-insensitive 5-like protein 2 [Phtheirospermum japonicum]|uniref:Abscisic acid-insensitive 5-like protein 2 n=1 Tax=Phtheirospermum japonicum TaxID=374723 RepID=A0A830BA18_9LAMI|nr:abscisic acid-insensitive 5-like protein 2 [Phtheirospermum japonicum]